MALSHKSQTDLLQIVMAGGGLTLDGRSKLQSDLVQLASAAAISGAKLHLVGMAAKRQTDLVQLAMAGKGNISFGD